MEAIQNTESTVNPPGFDRFGQPLIDAGRPRCVLSEDLTPETRCECRRDSHGSDGLSSVDPCHCLLPHPAERLRTEQPDCPIPDTARLQDCTSVALCGCSGFSVNLLPFGLPWQRKPPPTRRRLRCTQRRHRSPDYPIAIRDISMPRSSRCDWLAIPNERRYANVIA